MALEKKREKVSYQREVRHEISVSVEEFIDAVGGVSIKHTTLG
jgi:hypothetical protein